MFSWAHCTVSESNDPLYAEIAVETVEGEQLNLHANRVLLKDPNHFGDNFIRLANVAQGSDGSLFVRIMNQTLGPVSRAHINRDQLLVTP